MSFFKRNKNIILPTEKDSQLVDFTVYELIGHELYDHDIYQKTKILKTLTMYNDIFEGKKVMVRFLAGQLTTGTVIKEQEGFSLDLVNNIGNLQFAKDRRACWVCTSYYNKKCLDLFKDESP
jgi:hypothetical protein